MNAGTGHNSKQQIKSIVDRIERLEDEKQQIADDIKEIYAEAKGNGYDVKALRAIIRRRRQDAAKLAEHEALVETYMRALGMLADLPLGQAAAAREFADTKVTITSGDSIIETTAGGIEAAADFVATPAGRRKIRELAAEMPPPATLAAADTSNPPFNPIDTDEPRVADPDIPPFLQRA